MNRHFFLLSFLLSLFSLQSKATVVYVDSAHVGGTQNGTSWATAFSDFQAGINAANAGDSVWVAKGTYKPAITTSFTMKEGVKIFGGFLNNNTSFAQRSWENNVTSLNGNNSSVIKNDSNNLTTASHLDGFIVTKGKITNGVGTDPIGGAGIYNHYASPTISNCLFYGDTTLSYDGGGAMYNDFSSPVISNCTFSKNTSGNIYGRGGAILNINPSAPVISYCIFRENYTGGNGYGGAAICNYDGASPIIDNCNFINNKAYGTGGAIYSALMCYPSISHCNFVGNNAHFGGALFTLYANLKVSDCIFSSNEAVVGGAIYNISDTLILSNSLIVNNTASDSAGAIINDWSNILIVNCTIVGNSASNNNVGAVNNSDTSYSYIINSIIWGNDSGITSDNTSASLAVKNSLIQGLPADINNHNLDGTTNPLFIDISAGNYELLPVSPCINMGNNDSIPTGITTDLAGNNRIWDNTVDMGAYEYTFAMNLGNDTVLCSGNSIVLNAQNQGSSYLWNNGDTTQNIAVNTTGDYSVAVSNPWGTLTDTIHVSVAPLPMIDLGSDTTIVTGNSITLNAGNSGATYLWNTGATTQTITVNVTGTYSVVVTNSAGCIGTDTIVITVNPLGIGNINATANNITISPNPTKSTIHINITDNKLLHTKAILSDAYGRIVRTVMMENNTQLLSLAGLSSGIYILRMENGAAAKIVKD